jgi:hypothetical protein
MLESWSRGVVWFLFVPLVLLLGDLAYLSSFSILLQQLCAPIPFFIQSSSCMLSLPVVAVCLSLCGQSDLWIRWRLAGFLRP